MWSDDDLHRLFDYMLDPATAEFCISNQRETWPHVCAPTSSTGPILKDILCSSLTMFLKGKGAKMQSKVAGTAI